MNLTKVTITGADDKTDISDMLALSREFPFVEWGILVSKRQEGSFRFPTRYWIEELCSTFVPDAMNLSTHMCGRWVRDLLNGEIVWSELPACVRVSQRIQINTHAETHTWNYGMFMNMNIWQRPVEYIFQLDGVNDRLADFAAESGLTVSGLCDASGGAGISPKQWPTPTGAIPCGFAGGIGPDNVINALDGIRGVCPRDYRTWIDMERRVRTDDDSRLDMDKVRTVLEQVIRYESIYLV